MLSDGEIIRNRTGGCLLLSLQHNLEVINAMSSDVFELVVSDGFLSQCRHRDYVSLHDFLQRFVSLVSDFEASA
jgi:hypothetical protein